ncbi:MAG: hypothetical protein LBJ59_00630, partial [Zoogloeaceae bacterium]|nr:hypothetical protein [Zoogloeaceae bacterium]
RLNPQLDAFRLSAANGEGFDLWLDWLRAQTTQVKTARVRQLETQLALLRGQKTEDKRQSVADAPRRHH